MSPLSGADTCAFGWVTTFWGGHLCVWLGHHFLGGHLCVWLGHHFLGRTPARLVGTPPSGADTCAFGWVTTFWGGHLCVWLGHHLLGGTLIWDVLGWVGAILWWVLCKIDTFSWGCTEKCECFDLKVSQCEQETAEVLSQIKVNFRGL